MLRGEMIAVCPEKRTKHTNTFPIQNVQFLSASAKFRKTTADFVMSVRLSAWMNSASTGRIYVKLYIGGFYKICLENSSLVKSEYEYQALYVETKNYLFNKISLNSAWNEKSLR